MRIPDWTTAIVIGVMLIVCCRPHSNDRVRAIEQVGAANVSSLSVWSKSEKLIVGRAVVENRGVQQGVPVLSLAVELRNRSGHEVTIRLKRALVDPLRAMMFKVLPSHVVGTMDSLRRDGRRSRQQPPGSGRGVLGRASRSFALHRTLRWIHL